MDLPTRADVEAAHARINRHIHETPVVRNRTLDEKVDATVFLKCENLQKTGSFKPRGALNTVAQLSEEEREKGVVTHSSGNHAQGLAYAARCYGIDCTVVMPMGANHLKKAATEGYGATVVHCDDNVAARSAMAERIVQDTGATLVHPYDDPRVIAGAGTAALELLREVGDLDMLVTPVGGGGLASGTAVTAAGRPGTRVMAMEPRNADDAYRSLRSGVRVTEHHPHTIADGLRTTLGRLNFDILRTHEVEVRRVREEEIITAMQFIWERTKLLIEPSAAVVVAGVMQEGLGVAGKRVGIILSGGNVDARVYFEGLERLVTAGP